MSKLSREPPSVRTAAAAIVTATLAIVVGSGVLIRLLDSREYGSVWIGMWWAIQTVTTVGYGDVTPKDVAGRIVGTVVMLEGIAFVAIITAAITSTFVARASRDYVVTQAQSQKSERETVEERFEALDRTLDRKFDRIEAALDALKRAEPE